MPRRAANFSLVPPLPVADPVPSREHYPRWIVLWSLLAFCLSAWTGIVLAVARFA
jgi:hypothetical protein